MKKQLTTWCLVAVTGAALPLGIIGCASSDRGQYDRTTGEYIDDKVLAQRVKSALGDSDVYKFDHVEVNTYKGTVQLSGFVETDQQKQKAAEISRNVQGVYSVQNNITLKSETTRVREPSEEKPAEKNADQ